MPGSNTSPEHGYFDPSSQQGMFMDNSGPSAPSWDGGQFSPGASSSFPNEGVGEMPAPAPAPALSSNLPASMASIQKKKFGGFSKEVMENAKMFMANRG